MEKLKSLLNDLIGPEWTGVAGKFYHFVLMPIVQNPVLRWSYLFSTLLVIWIYYVWRIAPQGERSVRGYLRYVFPKDIWTHRSAVLDYKYYVLTQIVLTNLRLGSFIVGLIAILHVSDGVTWLVAWFLGPAPAPTEPTWPAIVAFTLLLTAGVDFAGFFSHYLNHRVPLLWEFHKVHHAAEVLTPFSAFRAHPVDQLLEFLFRMIVTAVLTGAFAYFYGSAIKELTILNYSAIIFFAHLTIHLRHSHVPIGYGPLSALLVSPVMHQLHHSNVRRHFDKNFGLAFSVWDRLFGTYYVPARDEDWDLGLPPASGKYATVWNLYFHPFAAAARLLGRPRTAFWQGA